jgi:glucose/arabinose dehydrogenase
MPHGYRLEPVVRGLDDPSAVAFAPDGRIFVLERVTGQVRVIEDGSLLVDPLVTVNVATVGQEGLLGIALHPDFAGNGLFYLYYTDGGSGQNRIVEYEATGNTAGSPKVILDSIGSAPTGTHNGGALLFGDDGKLYAAVGDMESPTAGQSLSSLAGKILRMDTDGGAPGDNPYTGEPSPYNLIYALGLCDTGGLAQHDGGTLYAGDDYNGESVTCDETNVVTAGTNYGWDDEACAGSLHTGPLHAIDPKIGASGLASYAGGNYPGMDGNLFVGGKAQGEILRDVLSGTDLDSLSESHGFYLATDAACPTDITDVGVGYDGWLYAVSADPTTGEAGLYRVIHDPTGSAAGPREVSSGPHLPFTLKASGGNLDMSWEDLKRDAWGCSTGHCPTGARPEKYTLWEGDLTSPFGYNHVELARLDGVEANDAMVSHSMAMPAGSKYYLVSARGANIEGPLGADSDGLERPGFSNNEICDFIARGQSLDQCSNEWPTLYPDQDNNLWSLADLRGKYVMISFGQFG